MKQATTLVVAAMAASLSLATAAAQDAADPPAPPDITLQVDAPDVMTSSGGEFATAASGDSLAPGFRVMVAEGGAARLQYGNDCEVILAEPGVHTVSDECDRGLAAPVERGTVSTGVIVGSAAAVIAIGAAVGGGSSSTPPPVSR